jgi:predicted lysophospholipase L1 biosynthesis ABC-type transport system permease subunit
VSYEIIGVIEDMRWMSPEREPIPTFLRPYPPPTRMVLVSVAVRTTERPTAFLAAARRAARDIDRTAVIDFAGHLDSLVSKATAQQRFYAVATASISVIALLICGIGVFAVVAASVSERTREIGIRAALGGSPAMLMRSAIRHAAIAVMVGTAVGTIGALWSVRLLKSLLFDVRPLDPPSFALALVTVCSFCGVAAWLPARRAARINPSEALRQD